MSILQNFVNLLSLEVIFLKNKFYENSLDVADLLFTDQIGHVNFQAGENVVAIHPVLY